MPDQSKAGRQALSSAGGDPVGTLASRALSVVASRVAVEAGRAEEALLQRMYDAAAGLDPDDLGAVADAMMRAGTRREDMVDVYIPEVARRLGAAWCDDNMSFATVTIGSARLQALLREVGAVWRADRKGSEGTILVVVGQDIHHTLGAMVLATQLRRFGYSVSLSVGDTEDRLAGLVEEGDYNGIMLSASIGESLETLRRIVELIRTTKSDPPKIILGGTVTDQDVDLVEVTGADVVTSDLTEALRHCGLIPEQATHFRRG